MDSKQVEAIATELSAAINEPITGSMARRICHGGCIHQAEIWSPAIGPSFFIKWGDYSRADMFQQEAIGLTALASTHTVRVPKILLAFAREDIDLSALILEAIEVGSPSPSNWHEFGQQLARLHQSTHSTQFGFSADNYLGSAKQLNEWSTDWSEFYGTRRLGYQVRWLQSQYPSARNIAMRCERLIADLHKLLQEGLEPPALIHGDLWSGNVLFDQEGRGVLIDPAAYYGQREAEWGMIDLFGGFPKEFRVGYLNIWPMKSGSQARIPIYRLYHCINHWNLFGESYLSACDQELRQLGY
jgi:fructosamine-3-kinase